MVVNIHPNTPPLLHHHANDARRLDPVARPVVAAKIANRLISRLGKLFEAEDLESSFVHSNIGGRTDSAHADAMARPKRQTPAADLDIRPPGTSLTHQDSPLGVVVRDDGLQIDAFAEPIVVTGGTRLCKGSDPGILPACSEKQREQHAGYQEHMPWPWVARTYVWWGQMHVRMTSGMEQMNPEVPRTSASSRPS